MATNVLPIVCVRCGSQDVHWLGETRASVFIRCNRCKDVWRLDPLLDRDRIQHERWRHSTDVVGVAAQHS